MTISTSTTTTAPQLPAPPACPPFCSRANRRGGHGWDVHAVGPNRDQLEGTRTCERRVGTAAGNEVVASAYFNAVTTEPGIDAVKPVVMINGVEALTPAQARRFAALLIEAADLIEGTGRPRGARS